MKFERYQSYFPIDNGVKKVKLPKMFTMLRFFSLTFSFIWSKVLFVHLLVTWVKFCPLNDDLFEFAAMKKVCQILTVKLYKVSEKNKTHHYINREIVSKYHILILF